jgi:hypothetical protein
MSAHPICELSPPDPSDLNSSTSTKLRELLPNDLGAHLWRPRLAIGVVDESNAEASLVAFCPLEITGRVEKSAICFLCSAEKDKEINLLHQ